MSNNLLFLNPIISSFSSVLHPTLLTIYLIAVKLLAQILSDTKRKFISPASSKLLKRRWREKEECTTILSPMFRTWFIYYCDSMKQMKHLSHQPTIRRTNKLQNCFNAVISMYTRLFPHAFYDAAVSIKNWN